MISVLYNFILWLKKHICKLKFSVNKKENNKNACHKAQMRAKLLLRNQE